MREAPPFECDGEQGYAWSDRSGVDFRAPLFWYRAALEALPYDPAADLLWVCSDDAQLAGEPQVCGLDATSWTAVLRRCSEAIPGCSAATAAACTADACQTGGHRGDDAGPAAAGRDGSVAPAQLLVLSAEQVQLVSQHPLLADWYIMRVADVLMTSNSSLSYTAALLNQPLGGTEAPVQRDGASSGHETDRASCRHDPGTAVRHEPRTPTAAAAAAVRHEQQHHHRHHQQRGRPSAPSSDVGEGRRTPPALLLRPDPGLGRLRPFDPWDELPLLPSAPVSANHSLRQRPQAPA
ncbi:hypothetical protein TSOC_008416 [Tetrabaena socialis]|uniref:Uncharacterized protein n=1 Tax=Tetrabaena socialis TaxID=47790 RepID=A0A2J7ZYK4_9CHLO|nr:hypothetical protein TSOC_008416 [Tetrabaena socialis]|eukprot:PNH05340.1 hypothetical protein TSOC_008416 [Tetrabaena socialis]